MAIVIKRLTNDLIHYRSLKLSAVSPAVGGLCPWLTCAWPVLGRPAVTAGRVGSAVQATVADQVRSLVRRFTLRTNRVKSALQESPSSSFDEGSEGGSLCRWSTHFSILVSVHKATWQTFDGDLKSQVSVAVVGTTCIFLNICTALSSCCNLDHPLGEKKDDIKRSRR